MELRKLVSKDIFPVCGILKKIGIKDIKGILHSSGMAELAGAKEENIIEALSVDIMMDLIGLIISNLPECQKEIYSFLESIVIVDDEHDRKNLRKTLENMEMGEFVQLIMDVLKKDEFKDFFRVALKSLK